MHSYIHLLHTATCPTGHIMYLWGMLYLCFPFRPVQRSLCYPLGRERRGGFIFYEKRGVKPICLQLYNRVQSSRLCVAIAMPSGAYIPCVYLPAAHITRWPPGSIGDRVIGDHTGGRGDDVLILCGLLQGQNTGHCSSP